MKMEEGVEKRVRSLYLADRNVVGLCVQGILLNQLDWNRRSSV